MAILERLQSRTQINTWSVGLVDDMLRLVEIRITSIWNWGHKVVAERLMPARVRKKSEILAELRRLVTDQSLSDEAFRAKANTLLLTDQSNARRSRAADVREVLSRNARRIRPILQLLTKLNLHGDGDGGNGLSWLDGVYHDGIDTFFLAEAPPWARRWKTLIEDSDTPTSARAYEAATAWAVRQGLRNGSLYSKYGFDYADPSSHWMPPETWKVRRSGYQLEKDLPNAEHLYTDRAEAALRASLSGLREAVAAGEVWVGRKDLYFRRDEAQVQPEGVEQAQNELYRKIGFCRNNRWRLRDGALMSAIRKPGNKTDQRRTRLLRHGNRSAPCGSCASFRCRQ